MTDIKYRPESKLRYPPYSRNTLEERFFDHFHHKHLRVSREYVDVFWTNLWLTVGQPPDLRDKPGRFFTVSQLDSGPENLPADTLVFDAAAGLPGAVAVPLAADPVPRQVTALKPSRDVFCSFVGSNTHPLRGELVAGLRGDSRFLLQLVPWRATTANEDLVAMLAAGLRSRYMLCPRGVGITSFRLYEAMQLGAVPVYVSDKHWLPYADELDWESFCVLDNGENPQALIRRLDHIPESVRREMAAKASAVYLEHFTQDAVCRRIAAALK